MTIQIAILCVLPSVLRSESMWAEIRFTSGLFEFWSDYITKIKKTFFKLILLPWWKKNLKEQKKHLLALPLGMSYYVIFSRQLISYKMKVWHPWQLKKSKSWGPFSSYQLNSTANSAHLPRNWAKWADLAALFSW